MYRYLAALTFAVVFNASANLLLKFAARDLLSEGRFFDRGALAAIKTALSSPTLLLGLILFALNVPLYFYALGRFKVSLAYPIMIGGGFAIIVSVASFSRMNERLSPWQWLGVGLIVLGVIVVARTLD